MIRKGDKHIDAALRIYHKETYDQLKLDLGDAKAANNETFKKLAKEIYPNPNEFKPHILEGKYNIFLEIAFKAMKNQIEGNTSGIVEDDFDDMPYRNKYIMKTVYLPDYADESDYGAEDLIASALSSDIREDLYKIETSIPESGELEESLLYMWSIMHPNTPVDYKVEDRDITRLYRKITGKPYPNM